MMDLQNQFILIRSILEVHPLFKYLIFIQLIGVFVSLFKTISDLLVLVPSTLLYLHLWRLITNLFVERNLIVLFWSSCSFYQFILYIQPNWSVKESLKYIVIVQFFSSILLVIFSLFLFVSTSVVYTFYEIEIFGSCALAMAALIALKQFIPDTVLFTTPYGRLKNGHLPICSIFVFSIFWVIGLVRGTVLFQIILSLQISWTYLRFFQKRGGMGEQIIGDRSEHFCWSSLFPRIFQPFAGLIGRFTFRSLHRFGLLKRVIGREHLDIMEENTLQMEALECVEVRTVGTAVLPPEGWDSERKRQKALRMLNERLMANNTINIPLNENIQKISDSSSSPQLNTDFGGINENQQIPFKFTQQTEQLIIDEEGNLDKNER
ncbi:hypothetical protein Mgra_00001283 [Meloidogyne graminicola]|uniref:Uncharacterized protein n=1 Tax=Meloidogyne graminicola TaxID=189291 RepID=A0A8T0A188_9BILA|nr:hypothetical protein Mgra_00001283 [Meloidogyne graminicola]